MAEIVWDEFRLVRAIAEARSLAGAADTLGINHSTVFRRLGALEKAMGARLFERSRTGYAPTAAGEKMVDLANHIADEIVDLERKITGQDLRPSGDLRVTTNDTLLVHLLSEVFVGFRAALFPRSISTLSSATSRSIFPGAMRTLRCARPSVRRRV
jgi:DNA-binding transcriptional LysR family regulator